MTVNCSGLDNRQGSFADYISKLANATGHDFTQASQCKTEVCTALWGNGNPDISGIGMTIGYISSMTLGTLLAIFYSSQKRNSGNDRRKNNNEILASKLLSSFNDSATFFAFSVQIASIVVLAKVDYGISAADMGDVTIRITWTVSVLVLLPLLYSILLPLGLEQFNDDAEKISVDGPHFDAEMKTQVEVETEIETKTKTIQDRRILLFTICWACSVYPLMSHMIETFGISAIGNGPGKPISNRDWHILQSICLSETSPPSNTEDNLINAFGIMASLSLSLFAVGNIIVKGLRRHYPVIVKGLSQKITDLQKPLVVLRCMLLVLVPLIGTGLIWSYIRLQRFQTRISRAVGNQDTDSDWGFGQIVSVVVFLPVFVEAGFGWYEQREEANGHESMVDVQKTSNDSKPESVTGTCEAKCSSSYRVESICRVGHRSTWPK